MDMTAERGNVMDEELDCIPNGDGSVCVKPWLWYSAQALHLFWEWAETSCILIVFGISSYLLFRFINLLTEYWLSGSPAYESFKNDMRSKQTEKLALDLSNTESERCMMKKKTDVLQEEIHAICDLFAHLKRTVDLKEKAVKEAKDTQIKFKTMKEQNDALYSAVIGRPRQPASPEDSFMDAELATLEELLSQARYELDLVGSEVLPKKEAKVMMMVSDMIALARKEEKIRDELHALGYQFESTDLSVASAATVHGDHSLDEMMQKYGWLPGAVGDARGVHTPTSEQGDGRPASPTTSRSEIDGGQGGRSPHSPRPRGSVVMVETEVTTEYVTDLLPKGDAMDENFAHWQRAPFSTDMCGIPPAETDVGQMLMENLPNDSGVDIDCEDTRSQHGHPVDQPEQKQVDTAGDPTNDITRATMKHLRSLIGDKESSEEQDDAWKWTTVKKLRELVNYMHTNKETDDVDMNENMTVLQPWLIPNSPSSAVTETSCHGQPSEIESSSNEGNLLDDLSSLRESISQSHTSLMEDIATSCLRVEGDISSLEQSLEGATRQDDLVDDDESQQKGDDLDMLEYRLSDLMKHGDLEYDVDELLAQRRSLEAEGVYEDDDDLQYLEEAVSEPPGTSDGCALDGNEPGAAGKVLPSDDMLGLARAMLPVQPYEQWSAIDLPTITFTPAAVQGATAAGTDVGFVPASLLVPDE